LVVDATGCNVSAVAGLDRAIVHISQGFGQLLNWNVQQARWRDLRKRAELELGKGTFWVEEMAEVIRQVFQQKMPQVMSSTFRGRGADTAGKIFRPQLARMDSVAVNPIKFRFVFYEVLVPELVRGPEMIGAVYNLLHLAGRVRWEVLNPFLRDFGSRDVVPIVEPSEAEKRDLIGRVSNSLRAIELEAERHDMLSQGISAFAGEQLCTIEKMFARRAEINAQ
jgi:hypothetical protein